MSDLASTPAPAANLKAGRIGDLQTVSNAKRKTGPIGQEAAVYHHIRVQLENGQETVLLLTSHQVKTAQLRAFRNPEDHLQISKFRNLFD